MMWWMISVGLLLVPLTRWVFRKQDFRLQNNASPPLKPLSSMPAPAGLPLIGNLHQALALKRPQLHLTLLKFGQALGQLYRLQLPPTGTVVVVADPILAQKILGRPGLPKSHRRYGLFVKLGTREGTDSVFTHTHFQHPQWQKVRKGMAACFSQERIKSIFPVLLGKIDILCDKLTSFGPAYAVEMQDAFARLALDVLLAGGGFEYNVSALDFKPCKLLNELQFCTEEVALNATNPLRRPFMAWLPFSHMARKSRTMHSGLYESWAAICDHLMAMPIPKEEDCSMAAGLRRLADPESDDPLTAQQLQAELATFIVAGVDTTAHGLAFALMSIAANTSVQERLAKELDEAGLLLSTSNQKPRPLFISDLSKAELPYLDAVINESLRMWSVIAIGNFRRTEEPLELDGYDVPAGTSIVVPIHAMHMSADNFEEAHAFHPERWLPSDYDKADEGAPKAFQQSKGAFMPFSIGPRSCIGQRLGTMMLHATVAAIASRFEISLAPRMGGWEGCLERQQQAVTMTIDGGVLLQFKLRSMP